MIISFNSSATSITAGQSVTITWETANATAVRLNGLPVATTGSKSFTPNSNQTYGLAVDGAATTITGSLSVTVVPVVAPPPPPPSPSPSPPTLTSDFAFRAGGTGVFRSFAFPEVGPQDTGSSPNYGYQIDAGSLGGPPKLDASFPQISGNALRFDVPSGSGSNPAGEWYINFSPDLQTHFGAGSTFYIQFRQRFDKGMCEEMVYMDPPTNANPTGIKQIILASQDIAGPGYAGVWPAHASPTHTLNDIVMTSYYMWRLSTLYRTSDHSAPSLQDFTVPGQYQWQNKVAGAPLCSWQQTTSGGGTVAPPAAPPACFGWFPDEWMTFQLGVNVGSVLGTITEVGVTVPAWMNTRVRLWIAREGKPSILVHDIIFDMPVDSDYGKLWLGPYMTSASPQSPHALMTTWYGELIFSRNPIPDPGAASLPPESRPPWLASVAVGGNVWTLGSLRTGGSDKQTLLNGTWVGGLYASGYWTDGSTVFMNTVDGLNASAWYYWTGSAWAIQWSDPRPLTAPVPIIPPPVPTPTPPPTPSPLSSLTSGQIRNLGQFTNGLVLTYARSEYGALTTDAARNRILLLGGGGHTGGFTNDAGAYTGTVPFDVLYASDTTAQLIQQQQGLGFIPNSIVYAATNHIPATHTFLAGCVLGDKYYLMTDGGYAVAGGSEDMSVFDLTTKLWSPIPATRLWYYVATARADPVSGKIIILGSTPSFFSALFVFDPATNIITQTTVAIQQFATGQTHSPEMIYHSGLDRFICIEPAVNSNAGALIPAAVHELVFNRSNYNASTYTAITTTGAGPTGQALGMAESPASLALDPVTGLITGMVSAGAAFNYDPVAHTWATKPLKLEDGSSAPVTLYQAYAYLALDPVSGCILFFDPSNNVYAYRP